VLTQRLLCTQHAARTATPAVPAQQARRGHLLVVSPAGRRDRHRAHTVVCGRPNSASGAVSTGSIGLGAVRRHTTLGAPVLAGAQAGG
jgi:hypothetical protein